MKDRGHKTFDADELAIVLSHYDLGIIESVTPFERGSRKSPKVGVVCERGKFLLKRRDLERGGLGRIRFAHALQAYLLAAGFPLPALLKPRDVPETMLTWRDDVYELFEFIPGHVYQGTPEETREAGAVLARFHELVKDFQYDTERFVGDYHDTLAVRTGLNAIPSQIAGHQSVAGREGELLGVTQALFDLYDRAVERCEALGLSKLEPCLIHSDWHPGNMLFRKGRLAAVVDYDSAKTSQRVLDVANGLLQFSLAGEGRPEQWPDACDESLLHRFLEGYESVQPLRDVEKRCLVPLMIEALIAECVVPIAATGFFGRLQGFGFMRIVRRKAAWFEHHAPRLTESLLSAPTPRSG